MTEISCACLKFSDRKLVVDILAVLFGISAWISVNGMFVQLPLMVQTQPENWNLPSYLAVIIQIANIGPILYSVSQKFLPGKIRDSWFIYTLLTFGTTASLLMGFFYDRTTVIGQEHSTALFVLSFFGALVGCTSSVLFMPFMGNFREIYLISYFVGEGLSGFVPSIVALIQGVGGNPVCVPDPNNSSVIVPHTDPPRFTTHNFYFFLFALMATSTCSFFLLNNLKVCKSERTDAKTRSRTVSQNNNDSRHSEELNTQKVFTIREEVQSLVKETEAKSGVATGIAEKDSESCAVPQSSPAVLSDFTYVYFLALAAWVCMFGNGIFPSIQSYSCLPYGNVAYHLSVTLGSMANPMACFLAFFYPYTSVPMISVLASLSTFVTGYILTTALLSPSPPLVATSGGEALVVSIANVIINYVISFTSLCKIFTCLSSTSFSVYLMLS